MDPPNEGYVQENISITWKRPSEGWTKLNCDGSLMRVSGCAVCGGILRGSDG